MKIEVLSQGYVKLIETYGSDNSILEAARQSTQNPTGADEKADDNLRRYLWRNQHNTPFEFAGMVIEVQLPLFVARQWQRHRTFSYNEFSARYSKMQETYYVPSHERMTQLLEQGDIHNKQAGGEIAAAKGDPDKLIKSMGDISKEAYRVYCELLQKGVSREIARCVLPASWYTRMRVSGNLLNWLKFIKLRNDSHAQYEIQMYAKAVKELLEQAFPKTLELFADYTEQSVNFSGKAWEVIVKELEYNPEVLDKVIRSLQRELSPGDYKAFVKAFNHSLKE